MNSANSNTNRDDLLHAGTYTPRRIHSETKLPENYKKCPSRNSFLSPLHSQNSIFLLNLDDHSAFLSISKSMCFKNQTEKYAHSQAPVHPTDAVNSSICKMHRVNLSVCNIAGILSGQFREFCIHRIYLVLYMSSLVLDMLFFKFIIDLFCFANFSFPPLLKTFFSQIM